MKQTTAKKSSLLILELAFFLALTLPPIVHSVATGILQENEGAVAAIMSSDLLSTALQGMLAIAMLARSRMLPADISRQEDGVGGWLARISGRLSAALAAAGLLLANSLLWNRLSRLGGGTPVPGDGGLLGGGGAILLVATTATAAFYEEVLYRWYGPRLLKALFPSPPRRKGPATGMPVFRWTEFALLAAFAIAHGYGGWPAVGNALVAGILLRSCALLTASPLPGFLAHLAYNLVQLSLLL